MAAMTSHENALFLKTKSAASSPGKIRDRVKTSGFFFRNTQSTIQQYY